MSNYQPSPSDKFTFGLWTVGNPGRDPFGLPVRDVISPSEIVRLLADVGAWGVNLHDNDLVPIDATAAERDRIVADFKKGLAATGLVVPMATTNLFTDPAFKDGAFTANDPHVRAYAIQKTMRAMDLGAELGAKIYVFWGGREGVETDASKNPVESIKRFREAINFLIAYQEDKGYGMKIALEAKPNEPRSDLFFPTTGAMLGFIATLDKPELVGVNPEVAHEHMSGLNFMHAVAQAWEAGKLFHIDLNDQKYARYDQDFRFGAETLKPAFFLTKFLEDVQYSGPKHFDAHAYRTEDAKGVREFAIGCMRTYCILREKVKRFNADPDIQAILADLATGEGDYSWLKGGYSTQKAQQLLGRSFDRVALGTRGLGYEKLDQLTNEVILGVR